MPPLIAAILTSYFIAYCTVVFSVCWEVTYHSLNEPFCSIDHACVPIFGHHELFLGCALPVNRDVQHKILCCCNHCSTVSSVVVPEVTRQLCRYLYPNHPYTIVYNPSLHSKCFIIFLDHCLCALASVTFVVVSAKQVLLSTVTVDLFFSLLDFILYFDLYPHLFLGLHTWCIPSSFNVSSTLCHLRCLNWLTRCFPLSFQLTLCLYRNLLLDFFALCAISYKPHVCTSPCVVSMHYCCCLLYFWFGHSTCGHWQCILDCTFTPNVFVIGDIAICCILLCAILHRIVLHCHAQNYVHVNWLRAISNHCIPFR